MHMHKHIYIYIHVYIYICTYLHVRQPAEILTPSFGRSALDDEVGLRHRHGLRLLRCSERTRSKFETSARTKMVVAFTMTARIYNMNSANNKIITMIMILTAIMARVPIPTMINNSVLTVLRNADQNGNKNNHGHHHRNTESSRNS